MYYFEQFPTVRYDLLAKGKPIALTNIMLRYKIRDELAQKAAIYYDYTIKEQDRPDTIADKYFGDSSLDWIIFITNNIIDPQWDWPLTSSSFDQYIKKKYGAVSTAMTTIHHYEKIIRTQSVTYDGIIVPEFVVNIDETSYNNTVASERRIRYCYDVEVEANETKRNIRLIDNKYVPNIKRLAESVFE